MEQVGIREFRHRLREYLARVGSGEGFELTLFGRPIAYLGPVTTAPPTLDRLIGEGKVTPPVRPDTSRLPAPTASTTGTTATAALIAERRSDER